jgi:addiction module HigA family antidote
MNVRVPAEVFPPGEFLREELEARGWTQQELADILDRPPRVISEIISAKRAVTPETARGLADAFGTSAEYWLNLESQYQLSKVRVANDHVARKARLYSKTLRAHWKVENGLHWRLDVQFGEDASRKQERTAATNLATVRRLSLNLLKQEESDMSLARKQFAAALNEKYLEKVLDV